MSNIEEAIKQLNEPDKSIGEALIEFYDTMKGLETNSHRGGLQATKIVMTINDIKQIIDNQTSTLRKEIEDLTRAYNQCSESHRRSVDSHCIEKELLQKEIEDLKEQNEKMREAIEKQISDYTHDLRESVSTCNKEYFQGALFILNHLKTLTNGSDGNE